jgi:hypothetical protein
MELWNPPNNKFSNTQLVQKQAANSNNQSMWDDYLQTLGKLRATSHTRLKALDHGNVRALIGRKGGDRPVHFTLGGEGPKAQRKVRGEKSTWSCTWRNMDKGVWSTGIYVRPSSWRWAWRKFQETVICLIFSSMTDFKTNRMADSRTDSRTDKHHQLILLNW